MRGFELTGEPERRFNNTLRGLKRLTLRVIDPFSTSREIFTMSDPRIYQVSNRANVIRGLLFSANWTFGKPPKHGRDPNDLVGPDN